jgi:hypothetical protein
MPVVSNKEGDGNKIGFTPRWKEELMATSDEGTLIFELTMGTLHVYFPDQNYWNTQAPAWAKDKWELYRAGCERWCKENNIPMSITDNALMYEEK